MAKNRKTSNSANPIDTSIFERKGNEEVVGFRRKRYYYMIGFFILLAFFDVLNAKLELFEYFKSRFKFLYFFELFNILSPSVLISQTFLAIVVTVLTIFFAAYFIIIQIFRNRYPLDFIERYIKTNFLYIVSDFICNLCFGGVLLIISVDLVISKIFYVCHVVYCISLFIKTYRNYKIFNPSEIINCYKEKIIENINSNNLTEKAISDCIKELIQYSEESFSKNEITVSEHIMDVYKDLILNFIQNIDRLFIYGEDNCKDKIEKLEKEFFLAIIYQLRLSINYNFSNYLENAFNVIDDIMCKCIICDKVTTFNSFSNMVDKFFSYTIQKENIVASYGIISLYGDLPEYVLSKDIRDEWLTIIRKKFEYYSVTTNIHMNQKILKIVFSEYFNFLELCIEYKKYTFYNDVFDNIISLIYNSLTKADSSIFNFVKILFSNHTNKLIKLHENDLIFEYINRLKELGLFAFDNSNKDLCIHISLLLDYIIDNYGEKEVSESILKLKSDFTMKAIYFEDELVPLFIPDYLENVKKNDTDTANIQKIISEFEEILGLTLYRKNSSLILFLLDKLNEIILIFDKTKRTQQEIFFEVYKRLFFSCIDTKLSEAFHIVLDRFSILLKNMDKEEKVSEQLGTKIINILDVTGKWCITIKQIDLCINIISEIADMPKNLGFIYRKKDLYSSLIETLFQIGLDAVENNLDDVIRNISNRFGWMAMDTIEGHRGEIFNEIIDKAVNLINMCIDFDISEKTIVFVGTLFIIVGGHTCSNNQISYMRTLISNIKKIKKLEYLNKSRIIRYYQSNNWNEYMNNNAKEYIDRFFSNIDVKVM